MVPRCTLPGRSGLHGPGILPAVPTLYLTEVRLAARMGNGMDIKWILTDKLRVTKMPEGFLVESLTTPQRDSVKLSFNRYGRLLFNFEDIETEDFMGYIGLLDEVENSRDNPVIIEPSDF